MYLLFVDESGTHGGSHAFVLGGFAIHEDDAQRLQVALDELIARKLGRIPPNLDEYELHAAEMRNAKKPKSGSMAVSSIWANLPRSLRLEILDAAYDMLAGFKCSEPGLAPALFGVVVDRNFHSGESQLQRERFAYEVLLNKFDVMLKRRTRDGFPNRGLVIHDRRVVAETDIQTWTSEWRKAAGTIGQLMNLADVPLFADSRATRLLQVADLVSYAIFRRYSPDVVKELNFDKVWPLFHAEDGHVHGLVHYTPSFGQATCNCEPCRGRLLEEGQAAHIRPARGRSRRRRPQRQG
ncbi:DUF3800 domain-containing protein [Nocardioides sp. NBC_00368]|uniref:DUF3800 domain-containing protein n=1 Tax=Nocardioides sp. NBC_00368 TaxID=2976000 RepID=UPI002E24B9A1